MTILLIAFDKQLGMLPSGYTKEIFLRHGFVIEVPEDVDSGIPVA
jgi:hypothetical protein